MNPDKSWYQSKKWLAYAITLAALIAGVALGGPVEVLDRLGAACMFGLPVLLGGQAYVDSRPRPPEPKP